jgi:hypothetical protein
VLENLIPTFVLDHVQLKEMLSTRKRAIAKIKRREAEQKKE